MADTAAGGPAAGGPAGGSVNFDRAAGYYDQTRGHPPDTVAAQTQLLAAELAGAGPVLEIGVGTGRIAVPTCAAGSARRPASRREAPGGRTARGRTARVGVLAWTGLVAWTS